MTWFKRQSGELDTSGEKKVRTEGLWVKCDECRQIIWKKDLEENLNVCPKCDKHFRIDARTRLAQLLDDDKYEVFDSNLVSTDPLKFVDLKAYSSRLKQAKKDTGLKDAIINAHGKLNGREVSGRSYPEIGVPDAHHPLSHHGKDPEKIAKLTKINTLHMAQVAYYLKRMIETKEGDGNLLDHTLVLAGASLADSNNHDHRGLPVLVAGGLIKGNRHVEAAKDTPMSNLMLSMMDTLGVQVQSLGDSTGRLTSFTA